jgi:N-hydroxyarylamine O-acetyltransferase
MNMHVDRYLERIGVSGPLTPNLETLRALHRAHLTSISYENLDVQLSRPVTIEIPAIYEKIVVNKRGGWCYEMNGIFGWALGQLGFRVTRATGAVMRELGGEASVGNHLVLRVEMDEGLYLADVGFGDGPIEPIRVAPGKFTVHGFAFDLARVDENWWRLHNHPRGGAPSFDFNLAAADETRFAAQCNRLQVSPESIFVQNALCFRHTQAGVSILRGRTLHRIEGESASNALIEDADEFMAILESEFALQVPEARTLWPKICARHDELFKAEAAGLQT